jgi:hypothetical protein
VEGDTKFIVSIGPPIVTSIGVIVALWNAHRAMKLSRNKNRADWMFQATMAFNTETRLYILFQAIDYDEFEFKIASKADGGDLGTLKEIELIFFLDFLNSVCAAFEADIFK